MEDPSCELRKFAINAVACPCPSEVANGQLLPLATGPMGDGGISLKRRTCRERITVAEGGRKGEAKPAAGAPSWLRRP